MTRTCEPGEHEWKRTQKETEYGRLYRCFVCGKTEVEP